MDNIFYKSIELIGKDNFNLLQSKTIMIIGLGGVGGSAFISLLRSGFKNFIIIDFDVVDETNLNRQLLFNVKDIGLNKVDCAANYAFSVNCNVNITKLNLKIDSNTLNALSGFNIDYIVDAIDDVDAKISLYEYASKNNIKIISSLGMGNRLNPSKIIFTTLKKTYNDPLAKKIRYLCRSKGIDLNSINVVFSNEQPLIKSAKPYSMIMVPCSAGLNICYYIINYFLNGVENEGL